ncbi:MAG TPA: metallophosphoesterase [Candidatus Nanoarchaeia archaeon]|nr:metallophosphoesterase [Candidatus Nanoarchaeia archaeon]
MKIKKQKNKPRKNKSRENNSEVKFRLIGKTIYFPEQGILAVGDLHLGYEEMLKSQGVMVPFNQVEIVKKELADIFNYIQEWKGQLNKVVLLGDIKHHFSFQKGEKFEVRKIMTFLEKYFDKENIILIKGNHERFELDKRKHHDYYLVDAGKDKKEYIAFLHGHKSFPEIFNKNVKSIVMGHLHPAVLLEDEQGIKREKYKCHLVGRYKNKKIFILPSFFPLIEGSEIDEMGQQGKEPSFIPLKDLKNFNVNIVNSDDLKVYNFGKLRNFRK